MAEPFVKNEILEVLKEIVEETVAFRLLSSYFPQPNVSSKNSLRNRLQPPKRRFLLVNCDGIIAELLHNSRLNPK